MKKPVTLANPAANRAAVAAGQDPFTSAPTPKPPVSNPAPTPAPVDEPEDEQAEIGDEIEGEDETGEDEGEPEQEGANVEAVRKAFFDEMTKLGRQQGLGVSSLISLAEKMTKAGSLHIIQPKDIKDAYIAFRKASNSAAGKNAEGGMDDHSITSNTGKLKLFYNVGAEHHDAGWDDMLDVAREMHVLALRGGKEVRDTLKIMATYEALVMVAREQMRSEGKGEEKFFIHPQLLTKDEISGILMPEGHTREKTVLDLIDDAIKAVERVAKGKEGIRDAIDIEEPATDIAVGLKNAIDNLYFSAEAIEQGWKAARVAREAAAEEARVKAEIEREARAEAKAQRAAEKAAEEAAKKAEKAEAKAAKTAKPAPKNGKAAQATA